MFGGDGDDQLWGGRGDDELDGGTGSDLLYGWEGDDTVFYGRDEHGNETSVTLSVSAATGTDSRISANPNAPDPDVKSQVNISIGTDVDTLVDIELVKLTDESDTVFLTGDLGALDAGGLTIDLRGAAVAFDQDIVDASATDRGVHINLGSGSVRALDQDTDVGYWGWVGERIAAWFLPDDLRIVNGNQAVGTQYSDYLVASAGAQGSGEGYSALHGGAGNDLLVGGGWESHLFGGSGDDQFAIGASTHIEDAEVHDTVTMYGIPLFGGVKQWWMEGNTAYWAPFTTVMSAFPVIGSSVLTAAAFFIDVVTMKFAQYQVDADGDLQIQIGWGLGGRAVVKDYHVDLDSGVATGGIVVFEAGHGDGPGSSLARVEQFVNLALKAGFGVGLHGFDPLVLDLDGDGFELTTEGNSRAYFEFDGDGFGERTGWVRPDDGLLAIDLNANGAIDDVTELFGNQTMSGFAMLAAHDLNADGVIDAADAVFANLRVWRDADQDGVSDAGELKTLAELGIVSISLANAAPAQPTAVAGNAIVRTGAFTRADGSTGAVADVAFTISQTATRWLGDATVSATAAALPQLKGFGEVRDLRVAMTGDAALEALVADYAASATSDLAALKAGAEAILYKWAGVDGVAADAIGANGFDARKLAFLERYSGHALMPRDANGAVVTTNLAEIEALWADQLTRLTLRLVVQGPMADEFAGIGYRADLDLLVAETPTALSDLYAGLLAGLPADPAAALAEWQAWAPLLAAMADGMRRFDANLVRADYIAAQLLAAMDGVAQPLDFATLAGALGLDNLRIGTGAGETLARGPASGTALYLGNGGADLLEGGGGQDVYIFGRQIGSVVIDDEEAKPAGDRIRFAFLAPGDVAMRRDGHDLLITVTATGETVRVVGQFAPVVPLGSDALLSSNKGVEEIQFADGTVWEIPQIMTAVGTGGAGDDHIVGTMHSDVLIGGPGNDRLEGGDDADLYVIDAGDGHDVIRDAQTTPLLRAADLVIFGDGIAPQDLVFARAGAGGDDLLIAIGGSGQSLLIEGQFAYTVLGYNDRFAPNSRIEAFAFRHYGDGWGIKDLQQRMIADATTAGGDTTLGFGDDDHFGASAGDDLLIGLDGADRYQWGAGSGHDVIDEQARYVDVTVGLGGISLTVEADTVEFAAGIALADLVFARPTAAPDLVVTYLPTGETLTVVNQFAGFQTGPLGAQWFDRIEWFEFADGTRISWQQVLARVTTGGDGDDSLWGDLFADRMDGGAGNDLLVGKGYGDTYVFGLGYGHDTLADGNTSILGEGFVTLDGAPDILELGPGISAADISFERSGRDVTLVVGAGGDRVTLKGQDDYFHTGVFGAISYNRIEEIRFDDGSAWSWQELNRRIIDAATTAGDDTIQGFMMADRFEASAGNDVLIGGDSGDTYVFGEGSGHDVVRESVSNVLYGDLDIVEFGPTVLPGHVLLSRQGSDLVIALATTGDTLTIEGQFAYSAWYTWSDVELFRFADGTEWTHIDVQVRLLAATAGDDHLVGFGSDDLLDGGAGNDILEGGDGADSYAFGRGHGHDIVRESRANTNLSENDRLVFAPDVLPAEVGFARDGDDLVVTILDSGDTLRVEGHFSFSNWHAWNDIESFVFGDGTVLTDLQVAAIILGGTPGDDHLVGTFRSDLLDGGAGNDILEGGDGADRYVFGRGYGQDEIRESLSNANLSENDQLQFGPDITLADLGFARQGKDLVVTILGTTDSLTIVDQFRYSNWYTWWDVDRFVFEDGTVLAKEDVQQIILAPTAGDDHLVGFMTGDTLDGGAGNDILEGGDGADTYVFGRGYGHDIIRETLTNANLSEDDRLQFGDDIALADLGFARDGSTLVITILDTGDTLRIEGQFSYQNWNAWWDVDRFDFADGSSLTKENVQQILLAPTAGDDHLVGFMTGDTLDGGAGNDILEGGDGADTYVFGRGYGQDEIRETVGNANLSENDTVRFNADVGWADLRFSRSGNTLVVSIDGTTDTLTIHRQWETITDTGTGTWWDVENFVFADGTAKTTADVQIELLRSTDGDDNLVGFFTADTLAGGLGDDLLQGGRGADLYIHNVGDGHDTISDYVYYYGSEGDRLLLGTGIAPADVTVRRSATAPADMLLSIHGGTSSVTLKNQTTGGREWTLDFVEFADGTVWTKDTLANLMVSGAATSGDDDISGTTLADDIAGGGGNDILRGLAGNDRLDGGAGNDRLEGGGGNDVYAYHPGGGDDVVSDYVVTYGSFDVIELGAGIVPSDITVTRSAIDFADMVLSFAQGGSITIDNQFSNDDWGIDEVRFADGSTLTATDLNNLYFAGAATSGADTIQGGWRADVINGLDGNDVLKGLDGNDTLDGGAGNDILEGEDGADTYLFGRGSGQDEIREDVNDAGASENDSLRFGVDISWSDLLFGRSGNNLIISIAGTSDSITIRDQFTTINDRNTNTWWDVENFRFEDGTVKTTADVMLKLLEPTEGDDHLIGFYTPDILHGAGGNDLLEGGRGNDRYLYNLGGGDDVVREFILYQSSWDVLELGPGLNASDLIVSRSTLDGNDMVLTFAGQPGSITLDNQWVDDTWGIDLVRFADGTELTAIQLNDRWFASRATAGADVIDGTYMNDTVAGLDGNDTLYGWGGSDRLIGGGGDDLLTGGGGNDTYVFNLGDGRDVVRDYYSIWHKGGSDTLEFGTGIAPGDVIVVQADDGRDLVLSIAGTDDRVTLDHTIADSDYRIEQVRFADGTVWSHAAMIAMATTATSGDDNFWGDSGANLLWGGAGNDRIRGLAGNDTLYGEAGHDILEGGTGNDQLYGGDGDDILLPDAGTDYLDGGAGNDTADISPHTAATVIDLSLASANANLGGGVIETWVGVENVAGGTGADILTGTAGANRLAGGNGNDQLFGGDGDDVLLPGNGIDTVDGGAGYDTVDSAYLAANLYVDLSLAQKQARLADGTREDWTNVEAVIAGTGADRLTGNAADNRLLGGAGSDRLVGLDGNDTLEGEAGDDVALGSAGADILLGGDGNDQLFGDGYQATGSDLIVNGSFEQASGTIGTASWGISSQTIPGWTKTNSSVFELVNSGHQGVYSTDGTRWLDLDGAGNNQNMNVAQTIAGRSAGEVLQLSFDAGNRTSATSGSFEVLWNGTVLATINATGVEMRSYTFFVTAVAGNNVLGFRGVGSADGTGASLDNVRLFATATGSGDDILDGGAGNDLLDGGGGFDRAVFRGEMSDYQLVTNGGTLSIVDLAPGVDGDDGTDQLIGIELLEFKNGETMSLASPIVLDLDGDGVELVGLERSRTRFDWNGDGLGDRTGWIGRGDGLLVHDRDGNGIVTDASEISFASGRAGARSDLDALRAFDSNGDGLFSAGDAAWREFQVWVDRNGDGNVDPREMLTLRQAGIASIDLGGRATDAQWAWGDSVVINRGYFTRADGTTGEMADVAFSYAASPSDSDVASGQLGFARDAMSGGSGTFVRWRAWYSIFEDLRVREAGDAADAADFGVLPARAQWSAADPIATASYGDVDLGLFHGIGVQPWRDFPSTDLHPL